MAPMVVPRLINGEGMDVSVANGGSIEDAPPETQWNGEMYSGTMLEYIPDHLAILPDKSGACSWEDGCGIRLNSAGTEARMDHIYQYEKKEGDKTVVINVAAGVGFKEIIQAAGEDLDTLDSGGRYYYVEEVYENDFVYRVRENSGIGPGTVSLYRQRYSYDRETTTFTREGEPVKVYKHVSYSASSTEPPPRGSSATINSGEETETETLCHYTFPRSIAFQVVRLLYCPHSQPKRPSPPR